MQKEKMKRNLRLYYWFQVLREPLFWGPIIIYFMQKISGMNLSEIYLLESFTVILLIFLQIPTGSLADLIGRRKTISIGNVIICLGGILLACANSALLVWISGILWAIGMSFTLGADSSLLFDTLKTLGKDKDFKIIEGRSMAYRFTTCAICSIFVGYLANINLRLPVFLSMLPMITNLAIICQFTEPPCTENGKYTSSQIWKNMKTSMVFVSRSIKIKWLIAFAALLETVGYIWFFSYNPYFELVNLPMIYFGWVFFALNLIAAMTSFNADWLHRKGGNLPAIILMLLCTGAPILALSKR